MKNVFSVLVFLLISGNCFSQGSIEVIVKGIKEQKGTIRFGLFNNEKDFLKLPVDGKVIKVSGIEISAVFENLKPGDYAVSVIHDENENGELDTNLVGIPKEGFAFGNNAMGSFGPPSFEKAKVVVGDKEVKQVITLKHF